MAPPCRLCGAALEQVVVDLGALPLGHRCLEPDELSEMEPCFPLAPRVCGRCFLVQLPSVGESPSLGSDGPDAGLSGDASIRRAERFAAAAAERVSLGSSSRVVQVASRDASVLQAFWGRGIPVLGVEPSEETAAFVRARGIPTRVATFGEASASLMASEGLQADLLVGIDVLPRALDLDDVLRGLRRVMKPRGVLALEFPSLLRLLEGQRFDAFLHADVSYFSLLTARAALARHGLEVFDVEELPAPGDSLRVWAGQAGQVGEHAREVSSRVGVMEKREVIAGLQDLDTYVRFGQGIGAAKRALLRFLIDARDEGALVVGFGAPAKASTLLNYCGVRTDLLAYTVDPNPLRQGRFLPGARIPIHAPEKIAETKPDYILLFPRELQDEVTTRMAHVRAWGGRFVIPTPEPVVLP